MGRSRNAMACGLMLLVGLAHAATKETGEEVMRGKIAMKVCQVPGFDGEALCGNYEVFEDRAAQSGRKISLKVVVVPATGERAKPDPIFVFLGGPGQGAATFAGYLVGQYEDFRKDRDLVFVDIRGTGESNPLNCDLAGPENSIQTYLEDMFDIEYVRNCRESLEKRANLALYTTELAMADVNDVREALGYEKINAVGGSYGTRSVLEFIRQFPEHVRTGVMTGLAPVTVPIPQHFARDAQAALDALIDACAADAECQKTFPDFKEDLDKAFAAFDMGPVTQTVKNPITEKDETVLLKRGVFATALRALLYGSHGAARIPLMISKAAEGDFEPFILYGAQYTRGLNQGLSDGYYLCVTCAEDLPFIDVTQARMEAGSSFLGTYRVDQQRAACADWVRGNPDDAYFEPLVSDVPVLLVSGEVDPVTPPYMGEKVLKGFKNGVHLKLPNTAHGLGNASDCLLTVIKPFIEKGHGKKLKTDCIAKIQRPPFVLTMEEGQ